MDKTICCFKIACLLLLYSCNNQQWTRPIPQCINDTINRPDYVSAKATYIIDVGGEVTDTEPCYIYWAEYCGSAKIDGKVYSHIKEIHVYKDMNEIDTIYLENMNMRNGKIIIDDKNTKVTPVSNGDGLLNISLTNGKDTIDMLPVCLYRSGLRTIASVTFDKNINDYCFSGYIEFDDITIDHDTIIVEFEPDYFVKYKPSDKCHVTDIDKKNITLMDNENKRIYFLDKNSYIDPIRY